MLLLVAAAQLLDTAAMQLTTAATTVPSFAITPSPTTQESKPALSSQAFSKQWAVNSDAKGSIVALETLALDLPGQVFITYASAPSSAPKQLASVKVFGVTAAFVDSVVVTSKRAMHGVKLVVSHPSAVTTKSSDSSAAMLTELVLMRKTALKKVIASGWANVVIGDDVLFTKLKSDYGFMGTRRALVGKAQSESTFTVQEVERQPDRTSILPGVRSNWTIITPTTSSIGQDKITLDIQLEGPGSVLVGRVDSDFLPTGSIGTVEGASGDIDVKYKLVDNRDVLVVGTKLAASNSNRTVVTINLAPNVEVNSVFPEIHGLEGVFKNLNTTFPDDAVSIFANGSGNVFVLANNSVMYTQRTNFYVMGSGFLQVQMREMQAREGISFKKAFLGQMTTTPAQTGGAIRDNKYCAWSPTSYSMAGYSDTSNSTTSSDTLLRCNVETVPTKVGGSKLAIGSTTSAALSATSLLRSIAPVLIAAAIMASLA